MTALWPPQGQRSVPRRGKQVAEGDCRLRCGWESLQSIGAVPLIAKVGLAVDLTPHHPP